MAMLGRGTSDVNFILKCIVLTVGILVNFFLIHPTMTQSCDNSKMIIGYHYSFLTIMGTFVIAYILFQTTPITEILLLVAAAAKLIIIMIYVDEDTTYWSTIKVYEDETNAKRYEKVNDIKYYILMVANIASVIFIAIDILLRIIKK